jgi:3-oxoacyl-(acyl-carrier-protein) synthase
MSRDVEITGWGAWTGAGDDEETRAAWLRGESSIRPFEKDLVGLPPGFGGWANIPFKDLRSLPGGRDLRPGTLTAFTKLACAAVGRALSNVGIEDPSADEDAVADRRGVYLGSYTNFPEMKKHLALTHVLAEADAAGEDRYTIDDSKIMAGMGSLRGFDFLKLMNNMPAAHTTIQANARGPANTYLGVSTAGLQAVGRAVEHIDDGLADQIIAGGTGPGTLEGLLLVHASYGALACDDGPGMVPGDAGACVVVESAETATARGAKTIARVAGYYDLFAAPRTARGGWSDPGPLVRLLRTVLDQAGWAPGDVDYIGATAAGMPDLDTLEADAYQTVFGEDLGGAALAIHTGITGFTEAAHGPLGLVGAAQAMVDGQLPASPGLGSIGPAAATTATIKRAIVVSIAPEGQGVAIAIERA